MKATGVSVERAAKQLQIPKSILSNRVRMARAGKLPEVGRGQRIPSEMEVGLAQIRKELAEVEMERDLLIKFSAYFAKGVPVEYGRMATTHGGNAHRRREPERMRGLSSKSRRRVNEHGRHTALSACRPSWLTMEFMPAFTGSSVSARNWSYAVDRSAHSNRPWIRGTTCLWRPACSVAGLP